MLNAVALSAPALNDRSRRGFFGMGEYRPGGADFGLLISIGWAFEPRRARVLDPRLASDPRKSPTAFVRSPNFKYGLSVVEWEPEVGLKDHIWQTPVQTKGMESANDPVVRTVYR